MPAPMQPQQYNPQMGPPPQFMQMPPGGRRLSGQPMGGGMMQQQPMASYQGMVPPQGSHMIEQPQQYQAT